MKKLILGLSFLAVFFTSCTASEDEITPSASVTGEITGTYTANRIFAAGTYTLKGIVKVAAGVTLTFDAGSTITCNKATGDNAFVVLNGGKVLMNGTASQPIIFTEASGIPGSWGGIIIYGDAPITGAGGLTTLLSEDGNSLNYGGTNATHNGGVLNYVRVEYAGSKLADGQKENNGFTFYSVGSDTVLSNLVSYKGADDGFEFFGGTVSMTNAVSYGNYDDAFDWQDGWRGQNNSNWYGLQVTKGNFGFEIESSNINNTFGPKVTNITLKRIAGCTPEVAGDIQVDAFQFKREGNGDYSNIVIEGYGNYIEGATTYQGAAVKIQDANTNNNQVNGSKIKLTNVKISTTSQTTPVGATSAIVVNFPAGQFTTNTTATGATIAPGAWTMVGTINLIQ